VGRHRWKPNALTVHPFGAQGDGGIVIAGHQAGKLLMVGPVPPTRKGGVQSALEHPAARSMKRCSAEIAGTEPDPGTRDRSARSRLVGRAALMARTQNLPVGILEHVVGVRKPFKRKTGRRGDLAAKAHPQRDV